MDTEVVKASWKHESALFILPNTLKQRKEQRMDGIRSAMKTSTLDEERKNPPHPKKSQ